MTTQAQIDYWLKYTDQVEYSTVEFYHPDFGSVYLVANQYKPKSFLVNGVSTEFTPVSAEIPTQPNNDSGKAKAQIKFGRIGVHFRDKLRQINQRFIPIEATLRSYIGTGGSPDNEYKLFVDKQGIAMDEGNVTVTLGYENPMLLQINLDYIYTMDKYTGLQNL